MKSPRQRGNLGNWLREARLARGYTSVVKAREALARLTGHDINYSMVAALWRYVAIG